MLRGWSAAGIAIATLSTKPATALSRLAIFAFGSVLLLTKAFKSGFVLKLNELLVVETGMVNGHVQAEALWSTVTTEAEISAIEFLV